MHKIRFPLGLRPGPVGGAYSCIYGGLFLGRAGRKGQARQEEGEARRGKGGREGPINQSINQNFNSS